MLMLVNVLIIFFIILIAYQIILANYNIVEGLENSNGKEYNNYPPNALILAQQNAGNIEYLKKKVDDLQNINSTVNDLSGNVASLQEQVNGLVSTQQQMVTQMTGGSPPDISGAGTSDDTTDTTDTTDT